MKKKIVIRVSMDDDRSRSKVLKISVCVSGVESAALKEDQLEVIGEGIDAVELTRQLRKSMSHAELVSVSEVKKPEIEKDNDAGASSIAVSDPPVPAFFFPPPVAYPVHYDGYANSNQYYPAVTDQATCTIQ